MDDYAMFAFDGGGIDWGSIINRGIDVAGAYASRSPYYSPDDPRYQQQRGSYTPPPGYQSSPYPQQTGVGVTLSTNTLMLIAGGILIFLVASRRR